MAAKKKPVRRKAAAKKPSRAKKPVAAPTSSGGRILPIDIDPRRVEEALGKIRGEVKHWANKGRFTKVRLKFRGKAMLPDLPLAAFVAAEGLTFYWGGILRALLVNFAGRSLLEVELISDADKRVQEGKEALLVGDLELALTRFREAIEMDRDHAGAHLQIGVALKLRGDFAGARSALQKTRDLDPQGPAGQEAERVLSTLPAQPVIAAG